MSVRVETIALRLRQTFTIARGSQDVVDTVVVSIERDGIVGYGEASPSSFYGHSAKSVSAAVEKALPVVERGDLFSYYHLLERISQAVEGNRAALCAIDTAILDWLGKRWGQPTYRVLGLDTALAPLSSFTIGISSIDHMRKKVREAKGYPILKVKLGTKEDLEIIRALRRETDAVIRVDANCAWRADETVAMSKELASLGVELIEQPLPPDELEAMEEVYRQSSLPLFADENAVLPEDVPRLVNRFHGINIKLVKCGGILPALRMIQMARTLGLKLMVGCMIESSVGISAAAQLAPLVDHLDLDGAILTSNDPFEGVENSYGRMVFPQRSGLGVKRRGDRVGHETSYDG